MNTIVQNLQKILEIKNELSGVLGSSSTPFSDYPSEFRKIKTNLIESEQKLDNIKMFSFDTKEETYIN